MANFGQKQCFNLVWAAKYDYVGIPVFLELFVSPYPVYRISVTHYFECVPWHCCRFYILFGLACLTTTLGFNIRILGIYCRLDITSSMTTGLCSSLVKVLHWSGMPGPQVRFLPQGRLSRIFCTSSCIVLIHVYGVRF